MYHLGFHLEKKTKKFYNILPNFIHSIYLRGFTDGGYRDSVCVVTKSTDFNYTPVVIATVVVVLAILILAGVIFVLHRRGTL